MFSEAPAALRLLPGHLETQHSPSSPGRHKLPFSVEALLARADPPRGAPQWLAPTTNGLVPGGSPYGTLSQVLPNMSSTTCVPPLVGMEPNPWYADLLSQRSWSFCTWPHLCIPDFRVHHPPVALVLQDRDQSPQEVTISQHKRRRTMFKLEQLEELEKAFQKWKNVVGKKRAWLAARLHLHEDQVGSGVVGSGLYGRQMRFSGRPWVFSVPDHWGQTPHNESHLRSLSRTYSVHPDVTQEL
ncbi:PREDICTED: homeobox protein notochord-like [Elephantulus edwardii]|uniref:homeobox protein notochord-like n=1 Tax=Elephantulus edwardii TaxID=28737 RepID=UPI0003F0ABE2|nr:PREDICTED: homeobox protein notochord-like [Elephantulus edwardii]